MTVTRRLFVTAAVTAPSPRPALPAPRPARGRPLRRARTALPHPRRPGRHPGRPGPPRPPKSGPPHGRSPGRRLEQTAFLHFGVNTFTGLEWGTGDEDPDVFQPTGLDTDQWARALRDGGFKLAILTVKHHDGFVLYPSRYTDHRWRRSSWRGGQGDVLRSFADSHAPARHQGRRLPLARRREPVPARRLRQRQRARPRAPSPPRRRRRPGRPDRASFTLDATDYGAHMLNQLYEVLTEYGPVDEVWFDGAQGRIPPDKVETYDWDSWYTLVRALAPDATIAVHRPRRALGRQRGRPGARGRVERRPGQGEAVRAAPTTRCRTTPPTRAAGRRSSRRRPSPTTCSGGPPSATSPSGDGWFYHADQQPKSVDQLTDIYFGSVGRNSVLLLNIPPDTDGLLHGAGRGAAAEFRERIERELPEDLARGARTTAAPGRVTVDLGPEQEVDRVRLRRTSAHGQQVEGFVSRRTSTGPGRR